MLHAGSSGWGSVAPFRTGFPTGPHALRSTGSWGGARLGSGVTEHSLSCPVACSGPPGFVVQDPDTWRVQARGSQKAPGPGCPALPPVQLHRAGLAEPQRPGSLLGHGALRGGPRGRRAQAAARWAPATPLAALWWELALCLGSGLGLRLGGARQGAGSGQAIRASLRPSVKNSPGNKRAVKPVLCGVQAGRSGPGPPLGTSGPH